MWAVSPGAPPTLLEGPIAPLREAQPTDPDLPFSRHRGRSSRTVEAAAAAETPAAIARVRVLNVTFNISN